MLNLFWKIVAATIPAVIIGGLFSDQLEVFRSMWVVGVCLIVWGVILSLAEKYSEKLKMHVQHSEDMSWRSAMIVGCMQVLAFIPGTSRSGVTMSAGLLTGFSKETAAKFSFLLAIPAIAGAGTITFVHVLKVGLDVPVSSLIAGFVAAFVAGIFSIRFLLLLIKKWSFAPFAIYRVVFGVILLIVSVLK
jgi:undecaprenyl-diphosphatase